MTRVALVLGAAVWAGGCPSPALTRRARHAAGIWHAKSVDFIVGCGGVGVHPPAEAKVIARLLRAEGVPESAIRSECSSRSTRENVTLALPILRALGAEAVVIVTDPWHAPRARMIARQAGLRVTSDSPSWRLTPRILLHHLPREALALAAAALRWR